MKIQSKTNRYRLLLGLLGSSMVILPSIQAAEDVSFSLSLDTNNHFLSYGASVWDAPGDNQKTFDGILFQPSMALNFSLGEGTGIYTGLWFDINNNIPSSMGGSIQEVDFWLGYYLTTGDFVVDFTFNQWFYAGEVEGTFDIKVSYDGMFSPYVKAHHRFDPNGGQKEGTIFEIGGTLYAGESGDISYSFPVGAAFSFDDYHRQDETGYAYSFIGATFSMPLGVEANYGDWILKGGATLYHTDKDFTGNSQSTYLLLSAGIGLSF
jgi:hypothetical protein